MNKTFLPFWWFFLATISSHAGWNYNSVSGTLRYSVDQNGGHPSFEEALKEFENHGIQKPPVESFGLMDDENFQKELLSILERDDPHQLHEALKSSGNVHNPKVDQLFEAFEKAALNTPTVQKMDAALERYGYKITGVECEEFHIMNPKTNPRFSAIWLDISKSH